MRFLQREIRIDRQGERFVDVKTANSVRTIPTDASVLELVAAHLAELGASPSGLVLHNGGRYVTASRFDTAFRATRRTAGLPARVRFHDLRHHAASELLGAGISVVAVAAILGDTPATVLRTYAHLVQSDDERIRAVMRRIREAPAERTANF